MVHHEHIREVEPADSGLGSLLAVIIALVVIALLLFYGLPLIRGAADRNPDTIDVNLNVPGTGGNQTPVQPGPTY